MEALPGACCDVRQRERKRGVHPCMVHRLRTNACIHTRTYLTTTYCQRGIHAHSLRDKETILTLLVSFTHTHICIPSPTHIT